MSIITALDPRNLNSGKQRVFAGVVVLGLIAVIVSIVGATNAASAKYDALDTCADEVTADCLEQREGRVSSRKSGDSRRYYFEPDDDSDRESLGKRSPSGISAATAHGLYLDGEFVGLGDSDGDRHYESSVLDAPMPFLVLLGGGLALFVGGAFLLGRELRRG